MDSKLDSAARLCAAALELIGVDLASLAMVVAGNYRSMAGTNELAILLDEQQFALGDGPTFDASNFAEPILVEDIATPSATQRWPFFSSLAAKHGIRSAHAFPLRIGGAHIGVISFFHSSPKLLSTSEYADGLVLAGLASAELVRAQASKLVGNSAKSEIAEIYQQSALQLAAGMVAEALNCNVLEGLVRIRARAFADDLPVAEVANAVLARTIVIEK